MTLLEVQLWTRHGETLTRIDAFDHLLLLARNYANNICEMLMKFKSEHGMDRFTREKNIKVVRTLYNILNIITMTFLIFTTNDQCRRGYRI